MPAHSERKELAREEARLERLVTEAIGLFLAGETREAALAWLRVRTTAYKQLERLW